MTHSESLPGPAASATHGVADNQENSGSWLHELLDRSRDATLRAVETARLVDREIHESFFPPPITVPVRGDAILSSGYAALNDALGCMGYPQGCVVEWIADADAGLPLLAGLCRALTAEGRYLALTDSAGSFDARSAQARRIDPSRVLVIRPKQRTVLAKLCESALAVEQVGAMVLDSALLTGTFPAPGLRDQEELWKLSLAARRHGKLLVLWHDPTGPLGDTPLGACHVRLTAKGVCGSNGSASTNGTTNGSSSGSNGGSCGNNSDNSPSNSNSNSNSNGGNSRGNGVLATSRPSTTMTTTIRLQRNTRAIRFRKESFTITG